MGFSDDPCWGWYKGEHWHHGAGRQPAPGLEVEAEEASRVCRGLMGPSPVTLGATSNTHHGHCSVLCVSQHMHP